MDPVIAPSLTLGFVFKEFFRQQLCGPIPLTEFLSNQVNWTHPLVSSQSSWQTSGELVLARHSLMSFPGTSELISKHLFDVTINRRDIQCTFINDHLPKRIQ